MGKVALYYRLPFLALSLQSVAVDSQSVHHEEAPDSMLCTGLWPTLNVLQRDEKAYSWEHTNRALIVCSSTKLMDGNDLINSDTAGY